MNWTWFHKLAFAAARLPDCGPPGALVRLAGIRA